MSYLPHFSHIYVEKEAWDFEATKEIVSKLNSAKIVEISHYKDIFNRKNQHIGLQKKSKKLILALKRAPFIYPVSDYIQVYSNLAHYYAPIIQNCVYSCDYCVLQGIYRNANVLFFVNIDEYFNEVKKLDRSQKSYLSISYDTDLLGFESIYPVTKKWLEFAKELKNTELEVRTKSANFYKIADIANQKNVTFIWTLLPNKIVLKYEQTPNLSARIESIKEAIKIGCNVRLCFDPLIWDDDFEVVYSSFLDELFEKIEPKSIDGVVLGSFRMNSNYLKNIKEGGVLSELIYYPFEIKNKVARYSNEIENKMIEFMIEALKEYGVANIYLPPLIKKQSLESSQKFDA